MDFAQKFAHYERKDLGTSRNILGHMPQPPDLNALIVRNLKYFLGRQTTYKSARQLALAAGVSPSFVQYMLKPDKRTTTTDKPKGYPTLDKLQAIAKMLPDCEVWMLLHPDIETQMKAMEMYKKIEADFAKLPPLQEKRKQNA